MYDYSKLRGRIVEKYGTMGKFADAFGISTNSMSKKMTNKQDWSQFQIVKASEMLDIEPQDMGAYFFTEKVQSD